MAGPRANLAVTKDGETYNKLQRPDVYLDSSALSSKANERKRELANVDKPTPEITPGNKRAKIHHMDSTASNPLRSGDSHPYRSSAPIADCGMRFSLPIDEDEAQYSDDSQGEALAYLRSVRSEASAIPNLLVASTFRSEDTNPSILPPSATTSECAFYHDGAWVSVDKRNNHAFDEDQEKDDTDPQTSYQNQLVKRFETLRGVLEQGANEGFQPKHELEQSPAIQPPSNRHEWLYTIDREFPTLALVFRLDEKNVKRGLEYCTYAMDRFDTISRQKSCWIWTLLALSGDVGTLDSQNMSHIRDLAAKAADMSNTLHASSGQQGRTSTAGCSASDAHDRGSKVGKPDLCDANTESHDLDTGYVQSDFDEAVSLEPAMVPSKTVPGTPIDAQPQSDILSETHNITNIDTNDNALEEARARLLAQLGDNLIKAGIPAPMLSTDETHARHSAQPAQGPAALQDETKIRAIPSRAEAERQRQVMRMRDSATAGSRQPDRPSTVSHTAVLSAIDDTASCAIDLNTRVTIDMILTVVAECYGQRDLLEFRKPW